VSRLAALLCALALAVLAGSAAAPAEAAKRPHVPAVGIGEQSPAMFADPNWHALGVRDVRLLVGWDVLRSSWERAELDAYLAAARASGARVLLALSRSRSAARARTLPSVARFRREFLAIRARYPWVRDFVTWNEANHCSQPLCRKPERAAAYYDAIRGRCRRCNIVAADVLDTTNMASWVRRFRKATRAKKLIWGLHNYVDANRLQKTGTRALLRLVKGDVWFTETGGIVWRSNAPSRIRFPQSVPHAAKATRQVFKLAALSPRITRVYFYNWTPGPTWDSALTDKGGRPRPAYRVLKRWLWEHGPAR
jgi:hypothetical protein